MSEYQADWFADEEAEDEENEEEEEEEEEEGEEEEEEEGEDSDGGKGERGEVGEGDGEGGEGGEMAVEDPLQARQREQDEHRQFPDEVALSAGQAARLRFSRFRALQSFRSSPWHPQENLPPSYGRVFQLQNLPALQKR